MKKEIGAILSGFIFLTLFYAVSTYAYGELNNLGQTLGRVQGDIWPYVKTIGALIIFVAVLMMGFSILKNRNKAEERAAAMMGGPYILGGAIVLGMLMVIISILQPYINRTQNINISNDGSSTLETVYYAQVPGVNTTTMQWLIIAKRDYIVAESTMNDILNKYEISVMNKVYFSDMTSQEIEDFFKSPVQPSLTLLRLTNYVRNHYDIFYELDPYNRFDIMGSGRIHNWSELVTKSKVEIKKALLEAYPDELKEKEVERFLSYFKF